MKANEETQFNLLDILNHPKKEKQFVLRTEVKLFENGNWRFKYGEITSSVGDSCQHVYRLALELIASIMRAYLHDTTCEVYQPIHLYEGISIIIGGKEKRTFYIEEK